MACLGRTGGFGSQWVFALRQCVGQERLPQRKQRNPSRCIASIDQHLTNKDENKLKGPKLPPPFPPCSAVFKVYKFVQGFL